MQFTNVPLIFLGLLCLGLVSTAPAPNSPWLLRGRQDGGGYYGQPSDDDGSENPGNGYPSPTGDYPPSTGYPTSYPTSSGTGSYPVPTATGGYPSPSGTGSYPIPSGTGGYPSATGTGGYASPTVTTYPSPSQGYSDDGVKYKVVKLRH